jgi:hypothetical protein
MGPNSSEPGAELKVEHWEEGRQDRKEPGPDPNAAWQSKAIINAAKKGPIKEQVAVEIVVKKVWVDDKLIRTISANEKASERLVNLKIVE